MDSNWSDILVLLSVLVAVIQMAAMQRRSARIRALQRDDGDDSEGPRRRSARIALQRDEVVDSDTNGGGDDADMEVDYDFGNDEDDIESQHEGVSLLCIFL